MFFAEYKYSLQLCILIPKFLFEHFVVSFNILI